MKTVILIFALIMIGIVPVIAQHQVRIMTYNLLNYPGPDTNVRNPYFRTVINATDPDILVVCEINTQAGVNAFLTNVMNYSSAVYSAGSYINGYGSDNAIYYKTSKFNFISNTAIATNLRDINEFRISDKIYSDTLRIYAVHLKANLSDSALRSAEVDSLRKRTNLLPQGTDFIVLGDFNIYSANESAYKKLTRSNPADDGNVVDPLSMTGVWNNISYSLFHTQSTRTRSFGDGSTGGLDDRFDMILNSNAVKNSGGIRFIPGSYTAYGNDGNHYNDSINKTPNNAVGQTIANALHYASDHLPVYATYEFGNPTFFNVDAIPEGMYNLPSNRLNRRDTITMYLRNESPPYAVKDSSRTVIDSVTFTAQFVFRSVKAGNYYLVMKTRNSIETWSSTVVQYSPEIVMSYNFTDSDSKAFGNNQILKGTKYCLYSGDLNSDGFVNLIDLIETSNRAGLFVSGYNIADMNGDGMVDLSDVLIVYNNSSNFITRIRPF
jgi:endonuclease/exonuclease/phosphatase family metal-dependent hydrolase